MGQLGKKEPAMKEELMGDQNGRLNTLAMEETNETQRKNEM